MTDTSASQPSDPIFVSVREAAKRLGMSIEVTHALVKAGEIAHVQHVPGGKIHVLASDLPRWATERAAATRKASA